MAAAALADSGNNRVTLWRRPEANQRLAAAARSASKPSQPGGAGR
jgi:hypothetical protein